MTSYVVVMPYVGGDLSENSYKWHKTRGTRPIVKAWMYELEYRTRQLAVPKCSRYKIHLSGRFRDNRVPDLSNLHKVIGDALKIGLRTDDKHFLFVDEGYSCGHLKPELVITIEGIE